MGHGVGVVCLDPGGFKEPRGRDVCLPTQSCGEFGEGCVTWFVSVCETNCCLVGGVWNIFFWTFVQVRHCVM